MTMSAMNESCLGVTVLIALIASDLISHKFECIIIFKKNADDVAFLNKLEDSSHIFIYKGSIS